MTTNNNTDTREIIPIFDYKDGDVEPEASKFNGYIRINRSSNEMFLSDGISWNLIGSVGSGDGSGAPANAKYLTLATNATLTQERVLTAGNGISITDDGGNAIIAVDNASETTPGIVELSNDDGSESGGLKAVQDNDPRLSDARTPTPHNHDSDYADISHSHSGADITSGTVHIDRLPSATTTSKGIAELALSDETSAGLVVQASDTRLSDARAPTTHNHTVNNVGDGDGTVYRDTTSNQINLKTIKAGANVTVTNNADDITISASTGGGEGGSESTTATSLGVGEGEVFKEISGSELRFRSLNQGTNVTISQDANEITIASDIPDASESVKGKVELATSSETDAGLVVQASDTRLSDSRTPTAHNHVTSDTNSGTFDAARLPSATESTKGAVELATSEETTSGLVVQASDTRLSDARTPTTHNHAATDINSGTIDNARLTDSSTTTKGIVELSSSDGSESGGGRAVQDNDTRLTDARTPTAHDHSAEEITSGTIDVAQLPNASEGSKGIVELATSAETTSGLVVQASDTRLSNSRTPTPHATSHKSAGSDSIKLDELAAPTDITTLDADASKHGLLKKLSDNATEYLDGTGNWSVPPGGGSAPQPEFTYFIYKISSTYYAQSGDNAASPAVTSNSDFVTLISGIINGVSAGTPLYIKLGTGDFIIHSQFSIPQTRLGNITIDGAGMGKTRLLLGSGLNGASAGTTAIVIGSDLTIAAGNTGTLTANTLKKSRTATMSTPDGAKFAQNDFVLLKSNKLWTDPPTGASIAKQGEIKQVYSTPASGVVTFDMPAFDTYNTANTALLYKLSLIKNITISNLTITNDAALTNATLNYLDLLYCFNTRIDKVEIIDNKYQYDSGITLFSCLNTVVSECNFIQNPSNTYNLQYGVALKGACQNCIVDSCTSYGRFRHSFEMCGGLGGSLIDKYAGICRNNLISNCTDIGNEVCPFDTHEDGEFNTFDNCKVLGTYSTYGFQIRSKRTKVVNCTVHSAGTLGFYFYEDADECDLVNCDANNCGWYGVRLNTGVKNTRIIGGSFSNNADFGIYVAVDCDYTTIIGVTTRDNTTGGILIEDSSNFSITNSTVSNNTNFGIYIDAITKTPTNFIISNNHLEGQSAAPLTLVSPISEPGNIVESNIGYPTGSRYKLMNTGLSATRSYTFPNASGEIATIAGTQTLTNKTIDADGTGNSITNIENADIKAGAAIVTSKLADSANFAMKNAATNFSGGQLGITGTSFASSTPALNIKTLGTSPGFEYMMELGTSTATSDRLLVYNATNTASVFSPVMRADSLSSSFPSTLETFHFQGWIKDANDTGTTGILLFAARTATGPLGTTRPIAIFRNYTATGTPPVGDVMKVFGDRIWLGEARNMEFGTTTGTKIGTSTTQKIAFHNATPVAQAAFIPSPTADLNSLKTAVDAIRTLLINKGLMAAS